MRGYLAILFCCLIPGVGWASDLCPAVFDHQMKHLHSSESSHLCELLAGKPALVVNTASHCGFTHQFEGLEALHQEYGKRGVGFLGVTSDSFHQAAGTEQEAAKICFLNFGVSFPMMAPVPVKGPDAHPLFMELAEQAGAPKWNFFKYVVDRNGEVVARFGATVAPYDPRITSLLDSLLVAN